MDNGYTADKLDDVADMLSGGTPRKSNEDYWNGSIPWLTPKDMGRWWGVTESKVTPEAIGNGTRLAPKKSIFIAVRGMSLHNEIRIIRPDCGFRTKPITESGASRSLIPIQADH